LKKDRLNVIILLGAFIYVLIRTICVDFTYDEIWTTDTFVRASFLNILLLNPCDANNHILNTLLIKVLNYLFGESVFVTRSPNLIAFGFYLLFAFRLSKLFENKFLKLLLLLLLCFNPFVLDFFGLARGYGLALAFQLAAIYYSIYFCKTDSKKALIKGTACSFLSVLSNFSFLPFMLALGLVLTAWLIVKNKGIGKNTIYITFTYLIFAVIVFFPLNKLRLNDCLYNGANEGFYSNTIKTLLSFSTGHKFDGNGLNYFQLALVFLFIVVFIFSLFNAIIKIKNYDELIIVNSLPLIGMGIIYAQHYILHTLFPIDRAGLCFVPLIAVAFILNIDSVIDIKYKWNFAINCLLTFLILTVGYNFFINANLYKTITWNFESHTTKMLDYIEQQGEKRNLVYKIDYSWPVRNSIAYYVNHRKYNHIKMNIKDSRNDICCVCDYYIFVDHDMPLVGYDSQKKLVHDAFGHTELSMSQDNVYLLSSTK